MEVWGDETLIPSQKRPKEREGREKERNGEREREKERG